MHCHPGNTDYSDYNLSVRQLCTSTEHSHPKILEMRKRITHTKLNAFKSNQDSSDNKKVYSKGTNTIQGKLKRT